MSYVVAQLNHRFTLCLSSGFRYADISLPYRGPVFHDPSYHAQSGMIIRFLASAPNSGEPIRLILNVETQNDFYPGYPLIRRGIYYCSRMISSQYGTVFTNSHYENIRKVYSIWICMNPPESRRNSMTRYRMTEENLIGAVTEPIENYDLMTAVLVCLGSSDDDHYEGVLKLLDVLLYCSTKFQTLSERQPAYSERFLPLSAILSCQVEIVPVEVNFCLAIVDMIQSLHALYERANVV